MSRYELKAIDMLTAEYVRERIMYKGSRRFLGYFSCPAAAHFAYVIAADKYFGEFARSS
jgi:hypothetical protein